jgi:hypothetical protein
MVNPMGTEITRANEFNQYDALNHREVFYLWLHDIIDGKVVPGHVSLANIFRAGISFYDAIYAAIDHHHDDLYASIGALASHLSDASGHTNVAVLLSDVGGLLSKTLVLSNGQYDGDGNPLTVALSGNSCYRPHFMLGFSFVLSSYTETQLLLWQSGFDTTVRVISFVTGSWTGLTNAWAVNPNGAMGYTHLRPDANLSVIGRRYLWFVFGPLSE